MKKLISDMFDKNMNVMSYVFTKKEKNLEDIYVIIDIEIDDIITILDNKCFRKNIHSSSEDIP